MISKKRRHERAKLAAMVRWHGSVENGSMAQYLSITKTAFRDGYAAAYKEFSSRLHSLLKELAP